MRWPRVILLRVRSLVLATHARPRLADQKPRILRRLEKTKGGGAPVGATVSWGFATQRMSPPHCAAGEAARPSGRARLAALHRGVAGVTLGGSASARVSWNRRVQTGGPSPAPVQRAPRGPARAGRAGSEAARRGLCRSAPGRRARCRNQEHPHDGVPSQRAARFGANTDAAVKRRRG